MCPFPRTRPRDTVQIVVFVGGPLLETIMPYGKLVIFASVPTTFLFDLLGVALSVRDIPEGSGIPKARRRYHPSPAASLASPKGSHICLNDGASQWFGEFM